MIAGLIELECRSGVVGWSRLRGAVLLVLLMGGVLRVRRSCRCQYGLAASNGRAVAVELAQTTRHLVAVAGHVLAHLSVVIGLRRLYRP